MKEKTILGTFNGEYMVDKDGRFYPISPNYASKSRLVQGDGLKLLITGDGVFIYKQIIIVPRQKIIAEYVGNDAIKHKDKLYSVLHASVTYYSLLEGDTVSAYIPKDREASWAAVDCVIPGDEDKELIMPPLKTEEKIDYIKDGMEGFY